MLRDTIAFPCTEVQVKFLVYLSLNTTFLQLELSHFRADLSRSSQFERGLIRITRRVNRTLRHRSDVFANQFQF